MTDVDPPTIAAVILAAGAGTRLGGVAKATLLHDGQTYLARILALCDEVGVGPRIVVIGEPFATAVRMEVSGRGATIAQNPEPERGMASSVACGFEALIQISDAHVTSAFLWPVDHPFVSVETLRELMRAQSDTHEVVRPRFHDRGGHPPLIKRAVWDALAACSEAPDGARGVLAEWRVLELAVSDAGVVRDVDVPTDLEPPIGST